MKLSQPSAPIERAAVLFAVALLLVPACSHRKGQRGLAGAGTESGTAYPTTSGPWGALEDDAYEDVIPLTGRPRDVNFDSAKVRRDVFSPVYFGFDEYRLGADQRAKVQEMAESLHGSSSHLIIAGHTDSIGTVEYNRNLGERRALAVRAALIRLGIEASRIHTVSYGEDRPARSGTGESAHAANRRAEFGLYRPASSIRS